MSSKMKNKKKKTKGFADIKSKIVRQIASEIRAAGGAVTTKVGHSKGNHLSSVFIKNP